MRPIQQTIIIQAAVANAVAAAQTPNATTGAVTIDGANAANGVATLIPAVPITLESTDNLSSYTFLITGTDANGAAQVEAIAGPDNATVTSNGTFSTITDVSSDAINLTTEEITIGSADYNFGPTDWWPLDIYNPNTATSTSLSILSGNATVTMEYTNEDPFDTTIVQQAVNYPSANLVAANSNVTEFTFTLMRAVRANVINGTATVRITVTQQSTV